MVAGGGTVERGVSEETLASVLVILLDETLFCGTVVAVLSLYSVVNKVDVASGDDARVIIGIAALHQSKPGGKNPLLCFFLDVCTI